LRKAWLETRFLYLFVYFGDRATVLRISSDVSLVKLFLFEEEEGEEAEERLRDVFEKDGIELGYPSW
jgi:hypothetical protein